MNRGWWNQARRLAGVWAALRALGPILTMVGCAPTMLVNVWRDPSIARPALSKLLVVSLRNDATRRRTWEDAFANELANYGVAATPSYRLCPQAAPDTSQMQECLRKDSFNGVLTVIPLAPDIEQRYVPGYWATEPDYWFGSHWDRYYRWWWYYNQPAYVQTYTLARNEIDVYMTRGGGETMVWSGTSDQVDPATMEEVRSSVADQVVATLARQGIIPGK